MKTFTNLYNVLYFLKMDISRYTPYWWNPIFVLYYMFFKHPGILFSFLYRFERYLLYESNFLFTFIGYLLYPFYFFVTYYFLSYNIHPITKIAGGLMLHNRNIVITENVSIGKYFTCMGQTTIGKDFNKDLDELVIGDDVKIGVGAKIIASGKMHIASHTVIGANAVVIKSISEPFGVYVGIPAKFGVYIGPAKK